jgi:hypothetical protein
VWEESSVRDIYVGEGTSCWCGRTLSAAGAHTNGLATPMVDGIGESAGMP